MPGILPRLAQYELTLLDWAEAHKGARQYVAFANKCWPAFQTEFGFVPCYVNSRLDRPWAFPFPARWISTARCPSTSARAFPARAATLLDINNTVPASIYDKAIRGKYHVRLHRDLHGLPLRQHQLCRC